jgi:hypothetical protein
VKSMDGTHDDLQAGVVSQSPERRSDDRMVDFTLMCLLHEALRRDPRSWQMPRTLTESMIQPCEPVGTPSGCSCICTTRPGTHRSGQYCVPRSRGPAARLSHSLDRLGIARGADQSNAAAEGV